MGISSKKRNYFELYLRKIFPIYDPLMCGSSHIRGRFKKPKF